MRKATAIELDDAQRKKLMGLAHSNTTEVRLARRAGIVLLAADGFDTHEIGEMLGVGRVQAGRWRALYVTGGFKAIARADREFQNARDAIARRAHRCRTGPARWRTHVLDRAAGAAQNAARRDQQTAR